MFKNKNIYFTFILLSIVIFLLTFFSGEVNDYSLYLKNWNISNVGANPWVTEFNGISVRGSGYGPLHTLIGYLALINPLMPKILFGGTSLVVFLLLVSTKNSVIKNFKKNDLFIILLLYPLFPLTIITAYIYGINDSIIALLVIIACKTRQQKKMVITGAVLGLGALLKFYPLLFLTFFSLSSKKGISLKCLRKYIKILLGNLILVVVFAIFIHGYMAEIEWEYISIIGTLLLFATYKVGHPQFYVSWTVLLAWLITSSVPGSEKNLFAWRLVPIAIYLGIFQSVYFLSGLIDNGHLKNNWQIVRDLGSVPFLFIILFCLYKNKFFFIKPWKKKEINFW